MERGYETQLVGRFPSQSITVDNQYPLVQNLSQIEQAILWCGLLIFVVGVVVRLWRVGLSISDLGLLLKLAFAAFAVPKGLFLIVCAFKPALLNQVKDLSQHLIIAGLCVVYLAAVAIKSVLEDETAPPTPETAASD